MDQVPDEILEFILSYLHPYNDFVNCQTVCKRWNNAVQNVLRSMKLNFLSAISECKVATIVEKSVSAQRIPFRYGHSCCRVGNFIYIFGGCTLQSTYLNDLWKFNLSTREWSRVLAKGLYPSPMAFATFVLYKNFLYLFGCTREEIHYNYFICNNFRKFDIETNTFHNIVSVHDAPSLIRHSATVHGDFMIVFGGFCFDEDVYREISNNIFIFDFKKSDWLKVNVRSLKPKKRYGQSQIYLDPTHLMIIGGFGQSKVMFQDFWILNVEGDIKNWFWTQIFISNSNLISQPEFLFANTFTRVEDFVVALARDPKTGSRRSKSKRKVIDIKIMPTPLVFNALRFTHFVKYKTERRRQQMLKLEKFEERIKNQNRLIRSSHIRDPYLSIYVLDIKNVLEKSEIFWRSCHSNSTDIEDLDNFSLIYANNELIVLGGKLACMSYADYSKYDAYVTNPKYFLNVLQSPKRIV